MNQYGIFNSYDEFVDLVECEESEIEEIVRILNKVNYGCFYYEVIKPRTFEEYMTELKEREKEYDVEKREEAKGNLEKDLHALETLVAVKELLDEFNLPETEDWEPLFEAMGAKIKGSRLPVTIHDYVNRYDYTSRGRKRMSKGERLSYASITVDIPSSAGFFYFYGKEENNFDIADDISLLQERVTSKSFGS